MAMNANRRKILVADCHDDTLIILEKLLEDAGFDTTTVWTAKDALTLLTSHVFDLVLVNKYLPDAECEELLQELSKRGESLTCIVMLPNIPEMTDFTSFEALGARDVVCKYAYRQVVETVGEFLACRRKSRFAA
jgi:CheY-like chemotaxis protein